MQKSIIYVYLLNCPFTIINPVMRVTFHLKKVLPYVPFSSFEQVQTLINSAEEEEAISSLQNQMETCEKEQLFVLSEVNYLYYQR